MPLAEKCEQLRQELRCSGLLRVLTSRKEHPFLENAFQKRKGHVTGCYHVIIHSQGHGIQYVQTCSAPVLCSGCTCARSQSQLIMEQSSG